MAKAIDGDPKIDAEFRKNQPEFVNAIGIFYAFAFTRRYVNNSKLGRTTIQNLSRKLIKEAFVDFRDARKQIDDIEDALWAEYQIRNRQSSKLRKVV